MRKPFRNATGIAVAGLLTLSIVPSFAAPRAERELLGIRIWNKFSDVLSRYGQPTRIENGLVTASGSMGAEAGGGTPGIPGAPGAVGGGSMMSGGGGKMGGMSMPGMPGMGGAMMSGGGGRPGGMSMPGMGMMSGGGGRPGMMGGGKGDDGGMSGMPGMGMPGMGMPGMGGAQSEDSEARSTWIYQRGPISNFFVFNKDGRVIQIETSGLSGSSAVTGRGVKLGDPVAKVYNQYGWTGKVAKSGTSTSLDFTRESHAAFLVQDMKAKGPIVVGMTVTLLDAPAPGALGSGTSVAGGPAGMPGSMGGGGMAMPGMPSMGGGMMSGGAGMGARRGGKMGAMGMPGMVGGK